MAFSPQRDRTVIGKVLARNEHVRANCDGDRMPRSRFRQTPMRLVEHALIALTAGAAQAELLTLDRRALATYERGRVPTRLVT